MAKKSTQRASTDKRVIKTKAILRDSLITLLERKPLKQISVTELTELADVNRSTFYFYYDDIYDMVDKMLGDIYETHLTPLINNAGNFTRTGDYATFLVGFLDFCKNNSRIVTVIVNNDIGHTFTNKLIADIRNSIPDSAKHYSNDTSKYYLTTFALNAILGTIYQWIRDGMKVPSIEMALFVSEMYFLGAKYQKSKE